MNREDDASYKLLFSSPEVVRDLVLGFIPDDWLHSLDYSTLEKMPGSYVTDDLRQRTDDVVWRIRGGQALKGRKLPPVLPIVPYNGSSKWTAATNVADLIPRAPGLVARHLPRLQYLLIDENQINQVDLKQARNLMAAIIQVERPASDQALLQLIDLLNEWLAGNPELRRTFAIWIRAVVLRQSRHTLALPKVRDLKELKMTLAERFDAWAQQHEEKGMQKGMQKGIERGIEKGIAKGEALVLQRLLTKRFGLLPADVVQMISTASVDQVETWLDRLFDAQNLDDVLRT